MPEQFECFEIAAWPAAKIQYLKRRRRLDVLQQRGDILTHVVIARALPECLRVLLIMIQRLRGNSFEFFGGQIH